MEYLISHQLRITRYGRLLSHVLAIQHTIMIAPIVHLGSTDHHKTKVTNRITLPALGTQLLDFFYDPDCATTAVSCLALHSFPSPNCTPTVLSCFT